MERVGRCHPPGGVDHTLALLTLHCAGRQRGRAEAEVGVDGGGGQRHGGAGLDNIICHGGTRHLEIQIRNILFRIFIKIRIKISNEASFKSFTRFTIYNISHQQCWRSGRCGADT